MSLVAILAEERFRPRLEELAREVGFRLLEGEGPHSALAAAGTSDAVAVVTEEHHPDWLGQLDSEAVRYWLVEVGAPEGPALQPPSRRPHRHLLGLDRSSSAYLRQLLDDWLDRDLVRVDCFNFAFRDGLPQEADWVLDTRFLDSPYWVPRMRTRRGDDPEVRRYVMAQKGAEALVAGFVDALGVLLPLYREQRRTVVRVAVGCTGGQHRSLSVAHEIVERITNSQIATARLLRRPPHHLPQYPD
jgi:hypothetical protein